MSSRTSCGTRAGFGGKSCCVLRLCSGRSELLRREVGAIAPGGWQGPLHWAGGKSDWAGAAGAAIVPGLAAETLLWARRVAGAAG